MDPRIGDGSNKPRPTRRLTKHSLYRRRHLPIRFPRIDPSARNPLHADVRAYLEYWRTMGYREAGVLLRGKALRRFVSWADDHGLCSIHELTPPILARYRYDLHLCRKADGTPISLNFQQLLLVPLKGFCKWLARTGQLSGNPAADLELPRKPIRLPVRVLSVSEVERLVQQPDTATPWGVRDRAILEVLYSTGMRRSELASLVVSDCVTLPVFVPT